MSAVTVHPDSATMPVSSALKNLAKVHDLPPFVKLFQSNRTAIVIVSRKHAEAWRAALAAGEFVPDTEDSTTTWTATAFWLGEQIRVVYGTHEVEL